MEVAGTIDSIVDALVRVLVAHPRFTSLCNAAVLRFGRSVVLQHLANALIVLSSSILDHAPKPLSPLERATAWMVRECRTVISLRVCEVILPSQRELEILLSVTLNQQIPFAEQQQQFTDFVIKRFEAAKKHPDDGGFRISHYKDESASIPEEEVAGYYDEDPPELELFVKHFSVVKELVCTGVAFDDMYQKLKRSIFVPVADTIENVVRKLVLQDDSARSVVCVIDWRVLEYLQHERLAITDIDSIFTLNGDVDNASVARLADYITSMWGTGRETLNTFKSALARSLSQRSRNSANNVPNAQSSFDIEIYPTTKYTDEQAFVKISGTFKDIVKRLEQVAWLTATLRPHTDGSVTVSDVDFRALQLTAAHSPEPIHTLPVFHLSLVSREKVVEADSNVPGECWTGVFNESILARGFHASNQHRTKGARGLELPFEIMTTFSGVRYPLLIDEQLVLAGSTSMLVPETKVGSDGIQWHFDRSRDWLEQYVKSSNKKPGTRFETTDISRLATSRAFLGYCKKADTLPGTADYWDVSVSESQVPKSSAVSFHMPRNRMKMDVDANGYGTTADGKLWKFNRAETALVQIPNLDTDRRVWQTTRHSTLLYDQSSSNAFMILETSLLLQFISTYLRSETQVRNSKIPVAALSVDCATAAYEAIKQSRDLTVPYAKRPSRKFYDIVDDYLDVLEQRRIQAKIREHLQGPVSIQQGLRGWDQIEAQAMQYDLWERELQPPLSDSPPTWWDLFKGTECLVFFTRITKSPIRRSRLNDSQHFDCSAWDNLPNGKHLLVSSIAQLDQLHTDLRRSPKRYATRYMLSDSISWARPIKSRTFEPCKEGGTCNPIQTLIDLDSSVGRKKDDRKKLLHHPGTVYREGAVIFADDPAPIQSRKCQGTPLPPSSTTDVQRKYMFIAVTFILFVLAYWNRWFFTLVLVLCGIAYTLS